MSKKKKKTFFSPTFWPLDVILPHALGPLITCDDTTAAVTCCWAAEPQFVYSGFGAKTQNTSSVSWSTHIVVFRGAIIIVTCRSCCCMINGCVLCDSTHLQHHIKEWAPEGDRCLRIQRPPAAHVHVSSSSLCYIMCVSVFVFASMCGCVFSLCSRTSCDLQGRSAPKQPGTDSKHVNGLHLKLSIEDRKHSHWV